MATIKVKRRHTTGGTASTVDGELSVNSFDKKIFIGNGTSAVELANQIGYSTITTLGTITTGTWNGTAIGAIYGGTGQTTYAAGDLLYSSATNTLSKLAKPSATSFLQMTSAGVPSWTDTIPTTDGGTGLTSFTSGGLLYASSTSALTTGTLFDIDTTVNANRINIASGASPKSYQEFKVSETAFSSSAAIGVYTDISDNPPGSLGQAYINLISTTGTDSQINLTSGSGSVTFAGGTTTLTLTATPSLWGSPVGVLYCIDDAADPYIIFGDDGSFNGTSIKITDTLSTIELTATTLKINTSTPASNKILSCTNSSGTVSWIDNTGTKTYSVFTPLNNQPPSSNFATLDTRNSIAVLDFDASTQESAVFVGVIPESAILGSGLSVRIHWMATSATSGNCVWGVQIERMNTDEDADSFGTAATATSTTNATSGIITTTSITITTIDSVAAGEPYRLKVYRDAAAAGDTMTGDAELVAVEVRSAS